METPPDSESALSTLVQSFDAFCGALQTYTHESREQRIADETAFDSERGALDAEIGQLEARLAALQSKRASARSALTTEQECVAALEKRTQKRDEFLSLLRAEAAQMEAAQRRKEARDANLKRLNALAAAASASAGGMAAQKLQRLWPLLRFTSDEERERRLVELQRLYARYSSGCRKWRPCI
jgi:chromosome segregation ATPase